MKQLLFVVLLALSVAPSAFGQAPSAQPSTSNNYEQQTNEREREAKRELYEAARVYREGNFAEAQRHSERALELDPSNKTAALFVARTIHAQYRNGVDSPENVARAYQAIAAYRGIYGKDPNQDEAFNAVAALLKALNEEDELRRWMEARALNEAVAPAKRSMAYVFLASKEWDCSFQVTENKANVRTVNKRGKIIFLFTMPRDRAEFDKASACTTRGLEYVNRAAELDPTAGRPWGFKTNLLLEARKLAEMDGRITDAAEFARRADEAQRRTIELNAKPRNAEGSNAP